MPFAFFQKPGLRDSSLSLVLIIGSLAAVVAVGYDLLVRGPFVWHLSQSSSVQGGLEAALLLSVFSVAAIVGRRWIYALSALAALVYLRRHNAELSLLLGILYVEFLLGFGMLIFRRLGKGESDADTQIKVFLLGLSCWLLLCLLLSMVYLAKPWILTGILLAGGVLVLIVNRQMPASVRILHSLVSRPVGERIAGALLCGWLVILAARSANVLGYDVLWYLGQGDRVLAPNGSIFEFLGFVSPVHYFPKLWETLLLPLTVFGQIRLQASLGIAVLGLLMVLLWQLAAKIGMRPLWRWWLVWALATLPAIANSALSLKTDLICACMMAIMCIQLLNWLESRGGDSLLYAMAAAALACSSKLTAIPYVGVAVLFTGAIALYRFIKPLDSPAIHPPRTLSTAAILTFILAVIVALILAGRTWLLAGVPTIGPDPLLAIWRSLGWDLKEPVGTLRWTRPQDWPEVPRLFYEWLLAPSYMSSIRISWIGNFWAVLALFSVLLISLRIPGDKIAGPRGARWLLLLLALTGLVLAVVYKYHSRGSDGNYFLFAVGLAACLSIRAVAARLEQLPWTALSLIVVICLTGFFHGTYSFISASWSQPGTRVFDRNFSQLPLPREPWREQRLARMGLSEINAYLKGYPRSERVIAHGFEQEAVYLPVRVEILDPLRYARPGYGEKIQDLLVFMERFDINHVLLAPVKDNPPSPERLLKLHEAMVEAAWVVKQDRGGVLYSRPGVGSTTAGE